MLRQTVQRMRLARQRRRESLQIEKKAPFASRLFFAVSSAASRRLLASVSEIDERRPSRQMLDAQIGPILMIR